MRVYAATNGHAECLRVAHELGGAIEFMRAIGIHVLPCKWESECLRVAHQLGGGSENHCTIAAERIMWNVCV